MEQVLEQILSKLNNLEINVTNISKTMATKDELEEIKRTMATKNELEDFKQITKNEFEDIKLTIGGIDKRLEMVYHQVVRNSELISMMAEKEDLNKIYKILDMHETRIAKLEEDVFN